jgi:SAM-dependent methyltransferase
VRVLDIGCGTGYGTAELAAQARQATGVDLSPAAVAHARAAYPLANIRFLPASATALPFADASFDLIAAFEVIEHLTQWRDLIAEARRVLRPDGVFLVSTPNRNYYTESRGAAGANPFHEHEFEFAEFRAALAEFFPHVNLLVQNHLEAFAFYKDGMKPAMEGRMDGVRGKPEDAHFFLGICAHREIAEARGFLFVHQGSNVLREREKHIESLTTQLAEAHTQFAELHAAHDEQAAHLREQNEWALRTAQELDAARERIGQLQAELEDRTQWALRLDAEVRRLEARVQKYEASRWMKLGRKLNWGPEFSEGE